jgi:hypothetical protein
MTIRCVHPDIAVIGFLNPIHVATAAGRHKLVSHENGFRRNLANGFICVEHCET